MGASNYREQNVAAYDMDRDVLLKKMLVVGTKLTHVFNHSNLIPSTKFLCYGNTIGKQSKIIYKRTK